MSFLHGWAIAIGSVALLAPLAVHFLTRPRPVAYPLSTIRFLREVIQQRRARSRVRDLLVLLLRILAVGLLAMALARPLWNRAQVVDVQPTGETARVVLLDVSQSMSAGVAGSTAIGRAQAAALEYLDYAPGLSANVVFVGARPRSVFDRLSTNLASLRESVRQATTRAERADVKLAMEEAGRLLEAASVRNRELVVISDFQRGNWGALFLDRIPEGTNVQLESVADADRENLAITAVRFPSQLVAGREGVVEVEIANYSDRDASVGCRVDLGIWQQTLEGRISAQSSGVLTSAVESRSAGWFGGWARLESNFDAVPADDVRPVAVHVLPPPRVLMISRQPAQAKSTSSFYLEQALRIVVADAAESSFGGDAERSSTSRSEAGSANSVQRIQPQRLDLAAWPEADLFVLNQPGTLETAAVERIAARVRRGSAMFYVAGSLADGINLERLAGALGNGFQPPVQLVPASSGDVRQDLFVRQLRSRQAPFRVFGESAAAAMQTARFGGGLATRATQEALREQVLAELSDASALLYATTSDAGQVAVLNADLDHSNWCTQPSFLPVLSELVQSLLSGRSQPAEAFCGEPLVRLLPADVPVDALLAASGADGHTPTPADYGRWEWSAAQGSMVWVWPEPAGAGVYQLMDDQRIVAMAATAAPPVEADLKSLDQTVLLGRLAGSRTIGYRDQTDDDDPNDDLWNWLIVACVLGMAGEIVLLRWFRA